MRKGVGQGRVRRKVVRGALLVGCFISALVAEPAFGQSHVARERYLDLVDQAVGAYSAAHMEAYLAQVREQGVTEHGFPRLCANLGVLLAKGRRGSDEGLFLRMMDACCRSMPEARQRAGYRAGNDFAVKEICLCIRELELARRFPLERMAGWRREMARLVPADAYSCQPEMGDPVAHNWAVFGAASEQVRAFAGLGGDRSYVARHALDQMRFFDGNGMYRDPNQPMVYDFVTRLQYAVMLVCGLEGEARTRAEENLLRSADPTLLMLSAAGEIPYGGRSNQFLHNETCYAALCEYYAREFHRRGDLHRAGRFREAARRAVDSLRYWLERPQVRHVKNAFPLETRYGTEGYGYFDKYMVTMGSWAYLAYLFADETVPEGIGAEPKAGTWTTGPDFHRSFLWAGEYSVQFDVDPDRAYDGVGLGRFQRRGAPPFLGLSVPFAQQPHYELDVTNATALAILPGWFADGKWKYPLKTRFRVVESGTTNGCARMCLEIPRRGLKPLRWLCALDRDGLEMSLAGGGEPLAIVLPLFEFDGERRSSPQIRERAFDVGFDGWTYRARVTDGAIFDTGLVYGNRNGHYRRLEARGNGNLRVRLSLRKDSQL